MTAQTNLSPAFTPGLGQTDEQKTLIENLSTPDTLLTRSEALAHFRWTYIMLWRKTKEGMEGVYGKGRGARYSVNRMEAWLAKQSGVTNGKKIQR